MTDAAAPALSVVIPSVNGWPDLDRCLGALATERESAALEVIVPERCGDDVRAAVAKRYPFVTVFPVSPTTSIPQMRAIGMLAAAAPTVAVIEDHVIVRPGWAAAMHAARTDEARVVGGHLINTATDNVVDWAAWLCEYHHLATPMPAGVVDAMHGNHTVYDRALLHRHRGVIESGQWEGALHAAIQSEGVSLWSRPDIVAGHRKHYSVWEYTSQRFWYSRAYAALRATTMPAVQRLIYGATALALPPLLLLRIIRKIRTSDVYRPHLVRSLPLLLLFVVAWGVGETVGAWFGDGGALAKVS